MKEEIAFGQVLRDYRTNRELSQEVLGFEADLSRNYISLLELGEKSPTLQTIFQLCRVLQVKPEDLIRAVSDRLAEPSTVADAGTRTP